MISLPDHDTAITAFRPFVRELLEHEAAGQKRNIVLLGLDGIPHSLSAARWKKADLVQLRSVFPTTSSTGWLSSLSGADVDEHGIPGVVFRPDDQSDPVNVFSYRGPLGCPTEANIFSDAAEYNYAPLAVVGDLESLDCSWRDRLLEGSQRVEGYRFYTASEPLAPSALADVLRDAIADALSAVAGPRLVWCLIDCDQRIHRVGYDRELVQFLDYVEAIAAELTEQHSIVLAHSDHGLTPTKHDDGIASIIEEAALTYSCSIGGAGRIRWFYARADVRESLLRHVRQHLPGSVLVCRASELLPTPSLARSRAGEIMLMAKGESFITEDGYRYDHGSLTDSELAVPLALWHG